MNLTETYNAETVQIYFPASLELQEELITNGFQVPIPTPIPIIYCNFGPWVTESPFITRERIIAPDKYGKTPKELGWQQEMVEGKVGYEIPIESAWLKLRLEKETNDLRLILEVPKYHLEKVSIRGVNPDKWTNWAMVYISLKDLDYAVQNLIQFIDFPKTLCDQPLFLKREKQQGGKEDTYFARLSRADKYGVPVKSFSLCLGCFRDAIDYFTNEAKSFGILPQRVKQLRLRIECDDRVGAFAKIGLSKMEGKAPQFMLKLASPRTAKTIKGISKPIIEGKARGNLTFCSHRTKRHEIIMDVQLFLRIACAMRNLFFGSDNPLNDRDCRNCYLLRTLPQWIQKDLS